MENKEKKLGLGALILMIFTSVYGFNNIPRSFYLMGYAAIPWFILAGITFFVPYAFMVAEYGSAFKNETGGIYSWMEKSVGPKYAFVATFMWYTSYVLWMVNICSGIWVPVSNALFGKDTTATWNLFGMSWLSGPRLLGILGIIFMIFITVVGSKGLNNIQKVTNVGGIAVIVINLVVLIGGFLMIIMNHGHFAQPFEGMHSLGTSLNPAYVGNPIMILSFIVYALFAYGGLEAVGGLVDKTDKRRTSGQRFLRHHGQLRQDVRRNHRCFFCYSSRYGPQLRKNLRPDHAAVPAGSILHTELLPAETDHRRNTG